MHPLLTVTPGVWPGGMPWPRPPHIEREIESLVDASERQHEHSLSSAEMEQRLAALGNRPAGKLLGRRLGLCEDTSND